jgi:hypothetical protein
MNDSDSEIYFISKSSQSESSSSDNNENDVSESSDDSGQQGFSERGGHFSTETS